MKYTKVYDLKGSGKRELQSCSMLCQRLQLRLLGQLV